MVDPIVIEAERRRRARVGIVESTRARDPQRPSSRRDPWADEIAQTLGDLARAELETPDFRATRLDPGTIVEAELRSPDDIIEARIAGGARKWFVYFRISEPRSLAGLVLLRSYNPPSGRYLSRNHALYSDWLAVVGRPLRSLPKRYTARSILGAFLRHVIVRIETRRIRDIRPDPQREPKGWIKDLPHDDPRSYSVADRVLGLVAGVPPCLERRSS